MKKCFASLLSVSILMMYAATSHAAPSMELSLEDWDLGNIYQWSDPSKEITIKNTGDHDLEIQDISTSCGCTAVVLADKVVKPGGKTALKIDFSAYNFKGKFRKEVVLSTNAGKKTVILHGIIKDDKASVGTVEPERIDLGVVAPYETKFFTLAIRNKGNIDLPVKGVGFPNGFYMDSAVPEKVPFRGFLTVRLGYRPPKASGPIDEYISVQLSNGQKDLIVRVVGYIAETGQGMDSVIITPASFSVSPGSPNASLEVGLKNQGGGEVEIESAECSIEGADASIEKKALAPGDAGKITMSIRPETLKPGTKGYLYIRVAVPVEVEGPVKK